MSFGHTASPGPAPLTSSPIRSPAPEAPIALASLPLRPGSTGDDVADLQRRLRAAGYPIERVTGGVRPRARAQRSLRSSRPSGSMPTGSATPGPGRRSSSPASRWAPAALPSLPHDARRRRLGAAAPPRRPRFRRRSGRRDLRADDPVGGRRVPAQRRPGQRRGLRSGDHRLPPSPRGSGRHRAGHRCARTGASASPGRFRHPAARGDRHRSATPHPIMSSLAAELQLAGLDHPPADLGVVRTGDRHQRRSRPTSTSVWSSRTTRSSRPRTSRCRVTSRRAVATWRS